MRLEDQVCSLELAKRLKELGVKQESVFRWKQHRLEYAGLTAEPEDDACASCEWFSAFTVAELGDKIKRYELPTWNSIDFWQGGTEANARAIKLIAYIEQRVIQT